MTLAKGTAAIFKWDGTAVTGVTSVEFDFTPEVVDATALGATAPTQFVTMGDLKWTVTFLRDVTDAEQNDMITQALAGGSKEVKIYETASKYYDSTCIITSLKVSASPKGVVTYTVAGSTANGTLATYN